MPYRLVKSNTSRTMLMREYYPSDSESESDFDSGYDTGYDSDYDSPWDDDWDDYNTSPKDKNNSNDDDDSDSESSHGNDIVRINHISLSNLQPDDTNSIDVNLDETDTDTDSEANSLADLGHDHDHDLDTESLNGYIDDDVYRYEPYNGNDNNNNNNNNGREEGSFHTALDVLIGESVRSEVEAALVADGPGYMGSASTRRNTRTARQAGFENDDDDDGYGRRVRRRIS